MKRDPRPVFYNALFLGGLGVIAYGLFAKPQWDAARLGIAVASAGLLALLGNMDRLESLKAGPAGIEARTRQIVAEAESALTELRLLAEKVATILFEMIDGGGRYGGGGTAADKDAQKRELLAMLERLGLSRDRLAAVAAPARRWAIVDYVSGVTRDLPRDPAQNAAWTEAWAPWKKGLDRPGAEELERILAGFGTLEPWRRELLQDYRHFVERNEHRRPNIWAQRDRWNEWTQTTSWPAS